MATIPEDGQLNLYSQIQMPRLGHSYVGQEVQWFGMDSEQRFYKQPHPRLGPSSVSYRFNAHGYRSPEFAPARIDQGHGAISVVTLGASEVFGCGVPEEYTLSRQFCQAVSQSLRRPVVDWNLGSGGKSADYLSRILVSALPILKPDIVLLLFPASSRREVIRADGTEFPYIPHDFHSGQINKWLNPEHYLLAESCSNLASDHADDVNMFKNWQTCAALCAKYDVMWLFSSYHDHFLARISHLLAVDHWVRPGLGDEHAQCQDTQPEWALARDMAHPGILPHQRMAERLFQHLNRLYPDRLARLRR